MTIVREFARRYRAALLAISYVASVIAAYGAGEIELLDAIAQIFARIFGG